ncbi:hypothetical protein RHGRI_029329 [Rhododendron griersonianum]|uniref:MRG domain-containing protein n=1 Tax=Rhododendron griersonianum TaxID=479676 RepID=A0AAV6INJ8_9ERIC|nr:hypothetical protein RHGRI_029329 [Rhododendron griersonianum]
MFGYFAISWDEWVGADRLMKHTEENVLKQQALDKKQGVDKNSKSGRSAQTKPKASSEAKVDKEDTKNNVAKGKKRKTDSGIEKDSVSVKKIIKIQIPSTLKKQLVDDWEFITQQDKVDGCDEFRRTGSVQGFAITFNFIVMTDSVGEILNGLRSYFDKALAVILLYKKERQQYNDAVADNVSPSTVYGAEHLLRLFVKLPELLAYVNIEEETLLRLQQKLLDFLKYNNFLKSKETSLHPEQNTVLKVLRMTSTFLQKNQGTFFLSAYDDGSKIAEGSGKGKDH